MPYIRKENERGQRKFNTNADALSRVELHNEEINSLIANPFKNPPRISDYIDTATIHIDVENLILAIPVSDYPLNKFNRPVTLYIVDGIISRPSVSKPFDSHTRTHIHISKDNIRQDVVDAIKEHVNQIIKTELLTN